MTSQRGGDLIAQVCPRGSALLGIDGIKNFRQYVARFTGGQISGRRFDRDRATRQSHQLKTVAFEFFSDCVEADGLRWGEIESFGNQHLLRFRSEEYTSEL